MTIGRANCVICEAPIVYSDEAQEVTCEICGKQEMGHCTCSEGHYVCDACHRKEGVEFSFEYCMDTDSKDPILILNHMMANKAIYPNGPEHHTLVGAALLAAYANSGGNIDKKAALEELLKRSTQVPGGTCGFWGVCGAAVSAGQFMSIILKASPMTVGPWATVQKLTSIILDRLSEIGGCRCCKRTGFTAVLCTIDYVAEVTGIQMEKPESVKCGFSSRNDECLKEDCPYYPFK